MKYPEPEWPISNKYEVATEDLPERPKQIHNVEEIVIPTMLTQIIDIERFRSLTLLLNTTARLIRLQRRYKKCETKMKQK